MIVENRVSVVAGRITAKVRRGLSAALALVTTETVRKAPRRTGFHARSIHSRIEERGGKLYGVVTHSSDYGAHLEQGTHNKDGSWRMRPRPHFRPALDENHDEIKRLIATGGGQL